MCFFQKEIYVKRKKKESYVYEKRGVCLGVYISKKSGVVKYLFCAIDDDKTLVVPASSIEERIETGAIYLKNLRTVLPTQAIRLTPFLPVYSIEGKYLGRLNGLISENLTVQKLIVGEKKYPSLSIGAVSDALLLTNLTYPLGEWSKEEESNVSRKILKSKIHQGELIRFTLSLPPFELYKNA
jgi:hypothetical protein